MFQAIITGKPTNFEFVDESLSQTLGACFTLTEKGWDGAAAYERRWVVWVPKHKTKWVERNTRKPEFTVIVTADWVNHDSTGIWSCRLSEVSGI
jgi:hypothetical protein